MRIFLILFCSVFTVQALGQQYSQYNTGTLYESFENPSIQSFTPDSSRKVAFNFFIPNISGNLYLTGNAQSPLTNRAFTGRYNDGSLQYGKGKFNRYNANANVYLIMLRVFNNLNGNTDMGFSVQSRLESRGLFSDESVALFNAARFFPDDHYENVFNDDVAYQTYHQISFSYRESLTKRFALGVKLSALLGIEHQKLNVTGSSIDFDGINEQAILGLAGTYRINYTPGGFTSRDLLPTLRNPGASISIGSSVRTKDNFLIQGNIKDLGFIRWNSRSTTSNFNSSELINDVFGPKREDSVYKATYLIVHSADKAGAFITPTNGKAEISANKTFWLNYDNNLTYSPTVIVSKEFFFPGMSIAMVNPVKYNNFTFTATTSYSTYQIFNFGGQFMVKSPNAEFFIGSERFLQSGRLLNAGLSGNGQINRNASYTGADFFMGFSVKFGQVLEHPMNASFIPMGEGKGFLGRLWDRVFNNGE